MTRGLEEMGAVAQSDVGRDARPVIHRKCACRQREANSWSCGGVWCRGVPGEDLDVEESLMATSSIVSRLLARWLSFAVLGMRRGTEERL